MIFQSIALHNFGVYRGRHRMDLTPGGPDRPVVLVGGMNGGGKTTLLDAVQVVLYGRRARCSNRGNASYEDYIRKCINRNAGPDEGAALEMEFSRISEGATRSYRLHRSWRLTERGMRETVEVFCDGRPDDALAESWSDRVEELIPSRLASLFFFDGEKIETLADLEASREVFASAIHSLLGLDLVDRLSTDLRVVERRRRSIAEGDTAGASELAAEESRLAEANERIAELVQRRAGLQNVLDRNRIALAAADAAFREAGGELFERRTELAAHRASAELEVERVAEELRQLAAGPLPLLLVLSLLEKARRQSDEEVGAEGAAALDREVRRIERRVSEILEEAGVSDVVRRAVEKRLEEDRGRRGKVRSPKASYLGLDSDVRRRLAALLDGVLEEVRAQAQKQTAELGRLLEVLDGFERQLEGVPPEDRIAQVMSAQRTAREEMEAAERQFAVLDLQREELLRLRDLSIAKCDRLLRAEAGIRNEQEDVRRVLAHSQRVRETLAAFRSAVKIRHVGRVGELILDSFRRLLRKQSLVEDLRIDPEDFRIELIGREGRTLPPDRLSAGERQLLAISILWGLARASGLSLPTIIDTPLGRLDSSHRRHVVERYFPHVSHQVILLSTDEEIVGRYHRMIKPRVARSYLLDFQDETQETVMREGYFSEGS